jgi:glucokinase
MEANLMPLFRGKVKVLPSGLQNQAAPILGASSLVWNFLDNTRNVEQASVNNPQPVQG